ncbi:MAG TPA: tetratricopeptide repeat protein [Thermoanaerobaculia bacterium]|nr:tetratricopeptide repeat protein [Thermoanaerobaculia bacterium]
MNATPRVHYEEIDWLDYVQNDIEPEARRTLAEHLSVCETCRRTVASMERLSHAIPAALHLIDGGGDDDAAGTEAIVEAAAAEADARLSRRDGRRSAILAAFRDGEDSAGFPWDAEAIEEAGTLCRELLRTDFAYAGRILRSALAAAPAAGFAQPDLASPLRSSLAYVRLREGAVDDCLRILDAARGGLDETPVPEIETGFWHYVRATALYESGRPGEALPEIRQARALYELLEDRDRIFRCRQVEAVLVSHLGRPEEAVELYRQILEDTRLGDDRAVHATLLMNYAADLVESGRLDDARRVYVRASALLESTGQESMLFRVRSGIASIAEREGRVEAALAMRLELRADFRALGIAFEEVEHELRIAELLLKLDRRSEASDLCRALLPRIEAQGLEREGAKAIAFLTEADAGVDLVRIGRVRDFFRRLENGEDVHWPAA